MRAFAATVSGGFVTRFERRTLRLFEEPLQADQAGGPALPHAGEHLAGGGGSERLPVSRQMDLRTAALLRELDRQGGGDERRAIGRQCGDLGHEARRRVHLSIRALDRLTGGAV